MTSPNVFGRYLRARTRYEDMFSVRRTARQELLLYRTRRRARGGVREPTSGPGPSTPGTVILGLLRSRPDPVRRGSTVTDRARCRARAMRKRIDRIVGGLAER